MDQVPFYPLSLDYVLTYPLSTTKQDIALLNALSVTANSEPRRRWIRLVSSPVLEGYLLTSFQHYDTKHRFECPECDDEFTTQAAMDQVPFPPDYVMTWFLTRTFSTTMRSTGGWSVPSVIVNSRKKRRWIRFFNPSREQ